MDDVDDLFHDDNDDDEDAELDYYGDIEIDAAGDDQSKLLDELENSKSQKKEINYTVLKEADLRQRMEDGIAELSTVLCISKLEASVLLRHYNWSVNKVHDVWFSDESGVRRKVGLLEKFERDDNNTGEITCGICFESCPRNLIKSAACSHPFCGECWRIYISTNVNDGPGCLMLRCPEPSCVVAVGEDLIDELASEEDKKKYYRYLARSYVENSKNRKWCPAPDCEFAIAFVAGSDVSFDVTCLCSHSFCWNCREERHRPVECDTVAKWVLKNKSENENENWKKAFTKPCPKCKRPIEKNEGCMHMRCPAPCSHHFCWLCLCDWDVHGYGSACNRYDNSAVPEETMSLREEFYRYQHYYDRWAANEKSMQIAKGDLQKAKDEYLVQVGLIQNQPDQAHLTFLTDAWRQIIECRRVLKWTYAYGYYLPADEHVKKHFFEYLQGQAESSLERLHDCAEREFKTFLNDDKPSIEFNNFRKKLSELTAVTKNYFENLVKALENGLSDVNCEASSRSSSKNQKKREATDQMTADTAQRNKRIAEGNMPVEQPWICEFCFFANAASDERCGMCLRGSWTCQVCTYSNPRTALVCEMCHPNLN